MADLNDTELHPVFLDERAFKELFNAHWQSVFSICLKYTGSEEDSRELTQDIFYSLWSRKSQLKIASTLSAYLHGAAKLKSFEFMRKRTRLKEKIAQSPVAETEDSYSASILEHKELSAQLLKIIAALPEPGKQIFRLSREESLSHKQIAASMGISVGMVEYYMGSALRFLRTKLKFL